MHDKLNDTVQKHYNALALNKIKTTNTALKLPNESDEMFNIRQGNLRKEVKTELLANVEMEIKFASVIKELNERAIFSLSFC